MHCSPTQLAAFPTCVRITILMSDGSRGTHQAFYPDVKTAHRRAAELYPEATRISAIQVRAGLQPSPHPSHKEHPA